MSNKLEYKNVLVLGFGITGQAVSRYLVKQKVKHTVLEAKTQENFDHNLINKLFKSGFCHFKFNHHDCDVQGFDLIMKSPGVPHDHPVLVRATEKNIPIKNDVVLFLEEWNARGNKSIGVTGSNGKSTIVTLLHQMLKEGGHDSILIGNIGSSPLDFLNDYLSKDTIAVLELSSYQLELFDEKCGVDVGIISNVSSNHLDHYDDQMELYAEAKLRIALYPKTKLILNLDDEGIIQNILNKAYQYKKRLYGLSLKTDINEANLPGAYSDQSGNLIFNVSDSYAFDLTQGVRLTGQHNLYNIGLVILASLLSDILINKSMEKVLREFPGLEHRLEFVREINGVKFVNDSKSTSPAATEVAIESFSSLDGIKNIILLLGGNDKGMDLRSLEPVIETNVKSVIILDGQTNEKIEKLCQKVNVSHKKALNMKEAVNLAKEEAVEGDVVLISPSASSFNWYKKFEDRGRDFKEIVLSL